MASSTASFLPGSIATIAGNGVAGLSGDGGAGTSAMLYNPVGVAVDTAGSVYIVDKATALIRVWTSSSGIITKIAGNGVTGFGGDDGAGSSAMLNNPYGVAVDTADNVYIADFGNQRIRKWTLGSGIITTIAGNGVAGFGGDGGAGTSASLYNPAGVAVDAAGNVYIVDCGNNRIRKWNFISGIITTLAGNGVQGFSGDGGAGTSAAINWPYGVAVDTAGNVYIADYGNNRIRKWTASSGIINTIAGNGGTGFSGDGGAGTSAMMNLPQGVALDTAGNVYIADTGNSHIRKWTLSSGTITSIAGSGVTGFNGDGGAGTSASLYNPCGVAVDTAGSVFIADSYNSRVRRLAFLLPPLSTPAPSPTPSPTPYCWPSLFRALPRMDLVGTLVGSAVFPGVDFLSASENDCRQACCDAPVCDCYTFASTILRSSTTGTASCFLYVNVTALVPSSTVNSGALLSVYS